MKVKELLKTVNVAWSPAAQHPILLATGTAAQQLDASFSTTSTLELYSLNLQQPGYDLELKASVPSDHRFHKIIWGSHSMHQNNTSGVIVGGCDKGTMKIYSATKLLANDPNALLSSRDRHKGAVRAMDFNPFKSNLLATGAVENEIFIWDIEKIEMPMKPGTCNQPPEDVQHVAWNKQVQHILASTFSQRCVIWDLRKNEAIIKLTDANAKVRWKVVEWHPDVATQLCLASEEDQAPVIELWDLRFATSPLKTLQNHQRGVLSIAWCPHDSNLLLSCSKDNRILCWNPNSDAPNGEVICELAQTTQWNFDVSWCPRHPGLIAASSFDGHAVIYSLLGGRQQEVLENTSKIADSFPGMSQLTQPPHSVAHMESTAELTKAPKWLKRPFGATFGFGGKLTIFENETQDPNDPPNTNRKVYVSSVITNPELIQRSNELETALKSMQYGDYCKRKIESTNDDHKKKVWKCISTYFEEDNNRELTQLLLELGYNMDMINHKLNQYVPQDINEVTQGISKLGTVQNGNISDGSATFDAIAQQEQNRLSPVSKDIEKDLRINTSDDEDGLITQAILMNNIEAAVSLCFKSKKYADAIILSMAGGTDLLARAQYRYFSEHSGALNALINSVVSENWSEIANNCDIRCWKETLVGILIHCGDEERSSLCDILGDRLLSSTDAELKKQAQICYVCSGNLSKMVDAVESNIEEVAELISIMQKALSYKGTKEVKFEGKVATILVTYAEMLAAEGSFEAALSFLGNSQEPKIVELRDRLNRNLGHVQQPETTPRPTQRISNQEYFDPMRRVSQSSTFGSMQPPSQPSINQWNTDPTRQSMNSYMTPQVPSPFNAPATPSLPSQLSPMPNQFTPQPSYGQIPPPTPASTYQPSPIQPNPASTYQSVPPPPPPTATTTSRPSSVGPTARPKHVIDPSIKPTSTYGVTATFSQPAPMYPTTGFPVQPANSMYPSNPMNTTFYNPNEADTNQSSALGGPMMQSNYTPRSQPTQPKYPEENIYRTDEQPGWNDPPNIKSSRMQQPLLALINNNEISAEHAGTRKWKAKHSKNNTLKEKQAEYQPQNPIVHPLGNVAQPDYGMPPQNNYYQQDSQMTYNQQPQQQYNPMGGQMYNKTPMDMYNQMPVQSAQIAQPTEPEKPKAPIPDEHMHLKTVLDELRARCLTNAKNPQTKRKVEEVSKKLEVLYDSLRENKLSQNTLQGLHQISNYIQEGDYTNGLGLYTQLVSGSDFSQIASFMPGIKVLLQSALQLGVYIR